MQRSWLKWVFALTGACTPGGLLYLIAVTAEARIRYSLGVWATLALVGALVGYWLGKRSANPWQKWALAFTSACTPGGFVLLFALATDSHIQFETPVWAILSLLGAVAGYRAAVVASR